jgi:hypothetical protein
MSASFVRHCGILSKGIAAVDNRDCGKCKAFVGKKRESYVRNELILL